MVVAFCFLLMFFFVPETFWDRTPRAHKTRKQPFVSLSAIFHHPHERKSTTNVDVDGSSDMRKTAIGNSANATNPGQGTIADRRRQKQLQPRVGFADRDHEADDRSSMNDKADSEDNGVSIGSEKARDHAATAVQGGIEMPKPWSQSFPEARSPATHKLAEQIMPRGEGPQTPGLHNFNSPYYITHEKQESDYIKNEHEANSLEPSTPRSIRAETGTQTGSEKSPTQSTHTGIQRYTNALRSQPPKSYVQSLKPWNGRLRHENWFKVALRPFILFAYPAILWSTLVYSLSIGWLIVLSESVSTIFKSKDTYNFTALQAGLVYISPFVGGVLGTAVAGKVSDIVVRFMSRRNGGVYEPEFRLVMAIPVAISTCIGLMGFGWSAQERDKWIVPTVFFGIISFGCSLGSTTSITFAVDSYRQYAGEALVTLNFSKSESILRFTSLFADRKLSDVFHGLVFSLFFNRWLDADGSKDTFVAIGGIQLACLLTTIPMYIYGKRARMWTVRQNLMEKF